ncbi:MAG: hypothetical protein HWE09_04360 [Cyclobacteriaceae bacterium]|nr:hypothetical protein [Cyclobacteriaceae bacterium]
MAKKNEHIDVIFREKLENHEVKPSQLAWERLEHQLPKQEKSNVGIYWWAAAAAVVILFFVGSLLRNPSQPLQEENLTAEKMEATETESIQIPEQEEVLLAENFKEETQENSNPENEKPKVKSQKAQTNPEVKNQFEETSTNLIAEAQIPETEKEVIQKEETPIAIPIERELPELKPMDLNQTVAELKTEEPEEPAYRLTIISDGIKEDKNLIADLGKKVDQVGGLLGKVDEGFANLQDAKNNLFASLTTRKEKMTEE